jgi:hypothetical protein
MPNTQYTPPLRRGNVYCLSVADLVLLSLLYHITISMNLSVPTIPIPALTPPTSRPTSPIKPTNKIPTSSHKMSQQFAPSGVPLSQLAWNTQLATGFNDFTPEQKYMRKVAPFSVIR